MHDDGSDILNCYHLFPKNVFHNFDAFLANFIVFPYFHGTLFGFKFFGYIDNGKVMLELHCHLFTLRTT